MRLKFIITCYFLVSCNISSGTLGGFDLRTFPTSKKKTEKAIDKLYKIHPEFKIPDKWKDQDNWSSKGYDFLESRIFYFQKEPEEMHYVTFIGDEEMLLDSNKISIAIRAVHNDNYLKWLLESDVNQKEKERIESRFDNEIISRIEKISGRKANREK